MTLLQKYLLFFFVIFSQLEISAQSYNPLWIPDTLTGTTYNLSIQDTFRQFLPGQQTITEAVNGNWWGPTLIFNKGDSIQLNVTNNLADSTTLHWHGIHLPPIADGGPHQVIPPGATWSPAFKVLNNAATYWYHPHLHMMTAEQVNMGIGGLIIVRDSTEAILNLPRKYGIDDIPIVLSDRRFDSLDNQIVESHFGDTMVVNGTINPEYTVPSQIVRFRILNAAPERFYRFGFSNNATFRVIATDGGLMNAPVSQTRFTIAPGERVEILVNFTGLNGTSVDLVAYNNTLPGDVAGSTPGTGIFANALGGRQFNMLHFNIGPQTPNPVTTFPTTLVTNSFYNVVDATVTRRITMSDAGTNCPPGATGCGWLDSTFFDFGLINHTIMINTTEIWEIQNVSAFAHPFHIHNTQFKILDRNGVAAPTYENGWKDVMQVRANTTARFITRFIDFADSINPYIYHCHNLFHEDAGMMGQFVVIDTMRPPEAILIAPDTVICAGDCISFIGTAATNVDHYQWIFDGGTPATDTLKQVTVCYSTPGTYSVTLIETNQSGSDTLVKQNFITVYALPSVSLTADDSVCINSGDVLLNGNPTGGTYNGINVIDSLFSPVAAGNFLVAYQYADSNGCINFDTEPIVVNAVPIVSLSTADDSLCANGSSVLLNASPSGGIYSGTGNIDSTFHPTLAGQGNFILFYNYSDVNGCSNLDSVLITVVDTPVVTILTNGAFCENEGVISLSATPAGGLYSGTGVTGNTLDPLVSDTGTILIDYFFIDINGCSSSDTTLIRINEFPIVSISGDDSVCINDAVQILTAFPSGGVFSGAISDSLFDPSSLGSGLFTIYYSFTNSFGCNNTDSLQILVSDLPVISFSIPDSICVNENQVVLDALPFGGTFTGIGVSGNIFSTSVSGVGSFYISYQYTSINGCTKIDSTLITVLPLPAVLLDSVSPVCIDAGLVTLNGQPVGGQYAGVGVIGSDFNPSIAGSGIHPVSYIYSNAEGCTDTASILIIVNDLPLVALTGADSICVNDGTTSFNISPAGGIVNGPGITNTDFDPAVTGPGTFEITYIYTDSNSCANSDTAYISVFTNPVVTLTTPDTLCIGTDPVLLIGNPSGGVCSGTGVTDSLFNSIAAGLGSFVITYNYTDSNTCGGFDQSTIVVTDTPTVTITLADTVCVQNGIVNLNGSPAGGVFSGMGVTGNQFDPLAAGIGMFTISYTYTAAGNCTGYDAATIFVDVCDGINEIKNEWIRNYPNPASDEITIIMNRPSTEISLLNVLGQELMKIIPQDNTISLPLSGIPSGVLFVCITSNGNKYYKRIVKR
jgi:FtsP/CotA-like multicopper oxidase with cupredoxin domain/PKD repeat protein